MGIQAAPEVKFALIREATLRDNNLLKISKMCSANTPVCVCQTHQCFLLSKLLSVERDRYILPPSIINYDTHRLITKKSK